MVYPLLRAALARSEAETKRANMFLSYADEDQGRRLMVHNHMDRRLLNGENTPMETCCMGRSDPTRMSMMSC